MKCLSLSPALAGAVLIPTLARFAAGFSRIRLGRALWMLFVLTVILIAPATRADVFSDTFSTDPAQNGWQTFGDTTLFHWDSTNQAVDVTWDSTQTNSYFYHPLGTLLNRNDDFTVSFDLLVNDAAAYGYGFELAVGLFNLAEATNADFQRSTGTNSPDLVELDYFPDVGYGPTVWPLFVDSASDFNYNGSSDYAIYAPTLGDWYHMVMTYSSSNQTMVTTMTNAEQTDGITVIDPIGDYFGDFLVNAVSISSYQDDGYGDSIYADGAVRNFSITYPGPPIRNLTQSLTNGVWQAQFCSLTNWQYVLQRSTDLQTWTNAGPTTAGNATNLLLLDTNPPACAAYYRINSSRP